jgi:MFS family permease
MQESIKRGLIMWGLMAFFSFFQFFMQMSGNLMEAAWSASFHLTPALVSIISSGFFYGYVLVQIPAGFFFDALGMAKVVRIAISIFVLGLFVFALSPDFALAVFGRFLMGAGAGFAFVGMVYAAASWFGPALFVVFVGLGEMFSMFLTAIGQSIAPHILVHYGWRTLMFSCAGIGICLLILVFLFLRNPPQFQKLKLNIFKTFIEHWREVVSEKKVWLAGVFGGGMFSVITVFGSLWGNAYLQERYQLSYVHASEFIALIPLGFAVGCPIMGIINERFISNQKLIVSMSFLLLLSCFLMMAGGPLFFLLLSLFLLGFFGSSNVLAFYIAEQSVTPQIRGIALGLCNAVAICIGMILQPVMGVIIEKYNLSIAMGLFPAILLLAFGVSLYLAKCA